MVRWIDPCGDQTRRIDVMLYRESFRSALYYDLYIDGLYLFFLCVGPMTTLIFMNIKLVQAIRYYQNFFRVRTMTKFAKLTNDAAVQSFEFYGILFSPNARNSVV